MSNKREEFLMQLVIAVLLIFSSLAFAENQFSLDPKFESFEGGNFRAEKRINDRIIDVSIDMLKKQIGTYEGFNKVQRDAHAKSHGCAKGRFIVNNRNIPRKHRKGIFKTNRTYESWIRFSNNDEKPVRHDNKGDLRGVALKFMGVEGEKIMDDYEQAATQDFLLYGSKIFFIKNNADYVDFIKALRDGNVVSTLLLKQPVAAGKVFLAQRRLANKVNLFDIDFFSATPVRLGRRDDPNRTAFKYAVSRCQETRSHNIVGKKDANYLRKNLLYTLRKNETACFDFKIQLQKFPDVMPIEDSSVAWPEKKKHFPFMHPNNDKFSPYINVGKIYFSLADNRFMNTKERKDYCEDLSFNPWHSIPEHKPLGRTMRMRRDVYRAISDFRRDYNNAKKEEPRTYRGQP